MNYRRKPRFENLWGANPECRRVTAIAWAEGEGLEIGDRLARCSRRVWEWGRRESESEDRELKQCVQRMKYLRGAREEGRVREFGVVQRRYFFLLQN